jgi:hypothetical protein
MIDSLYKNNLNSSSELVKTGTELSNEGVRDSS